MLDLKLKNSDHVKPLDNTYLESAIYALFKINIINYINNKASLAKNFHIPPSELDNMPMWEYELFLNSLNNIIKNENDDQQKEMDKYNINDYKKSIKNPSNYMKTPSTPKI